MKLVSEPDAGLSLKASGAFFLLFVLLMVAGLAAPRGDFVLVVANPMRNTSDIMRIIGDAGCYYVSGGRYGWIAVAQSSDPKFTNRLLNAGAVLVLNHALADGCRQGDL